VIRHYRKSQISSPSRQQETASPPIPNSIFFWRNGGRAPGLPAKLARIRYSWKASGKSCFRDPLPHFQTPGSVIAIYTSRLRELNSLILFVTSHTATCVQSLPVQQPDKELRAAAWLIVRSRLTHNRFHSIGHLLWETLCQRRIQPRRTIALCLRPDQTVEPLARETVNFSQLPDVHFDFTSIGSVHSHTTRLPPVNRLESYSCRRQRS